MKTYGMVRTSQVFSNFPAASLDCCNPDGLCVCGPEERILRAYIDARPGLPLMTRDQREWCLSEISHAEGFRREDHEIDSDQELARAVLDTWTEYARDKGLL